MKHICRLFLFCALIIFLSLIFPTNVGALSEKGFKSLHLFTKILHYVEENYVSEVDEEVLIRGAIRGMLGTLDPHTVYMSPQIYRELKVDTSGRFDGIGIEVTVRDGWLTVVSPVKGSPADKVGIQAGDRIVKIGGHLTKDLNLSEAVTLMRGKRGSHITLSIMRQGLKNPIDVSIVRRIIKVPSVTHQLHDGRIGYANISSFQQGTGRALERALKELSGKEGLSGLVLDLRKNPGGLLDQAVDVCDLFMDHGVIVTTESRGQEIDRREARPEGTVPGYPIVVLIDGGSASAAEIVAGALQDNKRATVMGTTSFGKGSVQTVVDLDDGSGLKLTIAHYFTPSGRIIQDNGVKPDIVVPAKHPTTDTGDGKDEEKETTEQSKKRDYQLERALEYLRNPPQKKTEEKNERKGK